LEIEKQILVSGLDWNWSEPVSSYPASTYTLKYILKRTTANPITLTSAADGDNHEFTIDDSDTATYTAGYYSYTAYVVEIADTDHIIPIATGVVEIKKDLSTVSDARTHAMTMVDNLRTTILALSTKTMSDVSIEGRNYTYNDIEKLEKLLTYYERKAGVTKRKRTLIQFSNT
jgi:hypothetical protein